MWYGIMQLIYWCWNLFSPSAFQQVPTHYVFLSLFLSVVFLLLWSGKGYVGKRWCHLFSQEFPVATFRRNSWQVTPSYMWSNHSYMVPKKQTSARFRMLRTQQSKINGYFYSEINPYCCFLGHEYWEKGIKYTTGGQSDDTTIYLPGKKSLAALIKLWQQHIEGLFEGFLEILSDFFCHWPKG